MPRRKTPNDYHVLAKQRGFRWLGPEVPNVTTKTSWECERGHQWDIAYTNIRSGNGCPFCAGVARKTPADYHALAGQRGFRWLGPEVPGTTVKTKWECERGHQWETAYSNIRSGRGCPVCAGVVPKTPADYHTLAKQRGFRWLGPEVPNIQAKTAWECPQGHCWRTTYNSIQQGSGCPVCAGIVRKPPDYHALAKQRGFRWLGPKVPTTDVKTGWECEHGHRWKTTYQIIQGGSGCPFCAGVARKTPVDYHALAAQRGFHWLGPETPNTKTKTSWECERGHRWEATYQSIRVGTGCPFCAGVARKTPDDYRALAGQRGFRWLGPEVPSNGTKTQWECQRGHRWEAVYHSIRKGTGCPVCAKTGPKTPNDYHALAGQRCFRWLGPEARNVRARTEWECERGHRWKASYRDVRVGSSCPTCAGERSAG